HSTLSLSTHLTSHVHMILPSHFIFSINIPQPPRPTLFPTRRSSDLSPSSTPWLSDGRHRSPPDDGDAVANCMRDLRLLAPARLRDRKSTRLNSSHRTISYAVFCLKKKKISKHIIFRVFTF